MGCQALPLSTKGWLSQSSIIRRYILPLDIEIAERELVNIDIQDNNQVVLNAESFINTINLHLTEEQINIKRREEDINLNP